LIVDDEPDSVCSLESVLEENGYTGDVPSIFVGREISLYPTTLSLYNLQALRGFDIFLTHHFPHRIIWFQFENYPKISICYTELRG